MFLTSPIIVPANVERQTAKRKASLERSIHLMRGHATITLEKSQATLVRYPPFRATPVPDGPPQENRRKT